jgi:hypothetical protein
MANFWYLEGLLALAKGDLDFDTDVYKTLLVMTNTTADTDTTAKFVGDFGTLDEHNGANYVRKTVVQGTPAIDAPNSRVEVPATATVWTALGAGTRQAQAAVLYRFVTNDADSPILVYFDTGGFPFTASGADFTVNWNAEGMIQLKSGV